MRAVRFALHRTDLRAGLAFAGVGLAVAATVISGLDYFFGLRNRIDQQQRERAAAGRDRSRRACRGRRHLQRRPVVGAGQALAQCRDLHDRDRRGPGRDDRGPGHGE